MEDVEEDTEEANLVARMAQGASAASATTPDRYLHAVNFLLTEDFAEYDYHVIALSSIPDRYGEHGEIKRTRF